MNVLARLWDRVSGTQPLPPAWVIGLTGLLAMAVVLNNAILAAGREGHHDRARGRARAGVRAVRAAA